MEWHGFSVYPTEWRQRKVNIPEEEDIRDRSE